MLSFHFLTMIRRSKYARGQNRFQVSGQCNENTKKKSDVPGGMVFYMPFIGGAPVAQWVKRWPTDLADRVQSSLKVKSSQL